MESLGKGSPAQASLCFVSAWFREVLLLSFTVTMWVEGQLPETTPDWLVMGAPRRKQRPAEWEKRNRQTRKGYQSASVVAFSYLVLTIWHLPWILAVSCTPEPFAAGLCYRNSISRWVSCRFEHLPFTRGSPCMRLSLRRAIRPGYSPNWHLSSKETPFQNTGIAVQLRFTHSSILSRWIFENTLLNIRFS